MKTILPTPFKSLKTTVDSLNSVEARVSSSPINAKGDRSRQLDFQCATAIVPILAIHFHLETPIGHTWTLAVEEHLYLILPLFLLLFSKRLTSIKKEISIRLSVIETLSARNAS